MARTFGAIYLRIWRNQDFRALSHTEQYLYWALIFQPKLNRAGLLEYSPRRWADANSSMTVHDVEITIKSLEAKQYVVLDESTNELLVRTYVRNDEAWKQPKVMASVVSAANEIESPKLRHALLLELDRIPVEELSDAPGLNGGPSIRSKIEKSIGQLRTILGGDGPDGSGGHRYPTDTPREGYRTATDSPEVPEARATNTPAVPMAIATSQRPAPEPAPEPEPEPFDAASAAMDPVALFDAAPTARDVEPGKEKPRELNAGSLVADWLEYRGENRPSGRIIGQVGKHLKTLLEEGIPYETVREGFQAWENKSLDPAKIFSCVNEVQSVRRRGGNVLPFQRLAPNDAHLAAAMERAQARDAAQAANSTSQTSPWKAITG